MTEQEVEKEMRYIDALPSDKRRIYLNEVQKARGEEVALQLRSALIAFWKSIK